MAALLILVALVAVATADKSDSIDIAQWKEYSLTNLPTATSAVVCKERDDLRSSVNLQTFAKNFRRLSDLARDASQGATDFGDVTVKGHVQALVRDVTGLIGKSTTTVGGFKGTTGTALQHLTTAFSYIVSGDSEKASKELQKVSELAKGMTKQSEGLHRDSEADSKSAQSVLQEVMRAKGRAEQNKATLEEKRKQLDVSKKKMEELLKSARRAELKAQELAKRAEDEANRARRKRKKKKRGLFGKIVHELGKVVGHDNTKKYKKQEQAARAEQQKLNQQRQAHHNKVVNAQKEIQQLESTRKKVQFDTQRAVGAINSLHKLTETFKSLSTTTLKVVDVWKKLQIHCEDLQNSLMRKEVEAGADKASHYFQAKAVRLYSRWLALQEESSTSSRLMIRDEL